MNTCPHLNSENVTFSVAGKPLHKDQCVRCFDDPVIYILLTHRKVRLD